MLIFSGISLVSISCISAVIFVISYLLLILSLVYSFANFLPGGLDGKESACNVADQGSVPGLGRSPREGNGNPVQYSCLENPMDRGVWQATVHRVTKSQIRVSD